MTHRARTYVFAGGGTGGHLAPALAVAEEVTAADCDARILFLCTDRAIDTRMLGPTEFAVVTQPVHPIEKKPIRWAGFYIRWRRSLSLARTILRDVKPVAVLGLGGFAAGPMVRVAPAAGVPTALLNPDAVPGKANRYLADRAETIFTQFDSTAGCFAPPVRRRVVRVGCPVRRQLLDCDVSAGRASLGLRDDLRTLVVMGGSLGAETINRAMLECVGALADRADSWQVLHVTGPGKAESARHVYRQAGVTAEVREFCRDMGQVYAVADLLVGRAGASTIAELTATGTPAVLVPYPFHADHHQRLNAAPMAQAGAAVVVEDAVDPRKNADRLSTALAPLLRDPSGLTAMARSAAELGRPDAAGEVARWMIDRARQFVGVQHPSATAAAPARPPDTACDARTPAT